MHNFNGFVRDCSKLVSDCFHGSCYCASEGLRTLALLKLAQVGSREVNSLRKDPDNGKQQCSQLAAHHAPCTEYLMSSSLIQRMYLCFSRRQ